VFRVGSAPSLARREDRARRPCSAFLTDLSDAAAFIRPELKGLLSPRQPPHRSSTAALNPHGS
jgi:hypothetical protein